MVDTGSDATVVLQERPLSDMTAPAEMSLEQTYDLYAESFFRYALAITGSPEDAEDAVQEVFVRLAREQSRLKSARNLKAYLFTATRNAAFSVLRGKRRRHQLQETIRNQFRVGLAEERTDVSEECALAVREFEALPVEQREVLVLKIFDGMTFKEIARTTGASIGTAAARYRYGIAKLRRRLQEEDDG